MRQRVDWVTFFRQCSRPHGVRARLLDVELTSPKAPLAEKRLVAFLKEMSINEPFALRRSFNSGPCQIDCVFASNAFADEVATALGATPVKPPIGWASAREFASGHQALWRGLKLPAERPQTSFRREPPHPPSAPAAGRPASTSAPIARALGRISAMSLEQQAASLFEVLTDSQATRRHEWSTGEE